MPSRFIKTTTTALVEHLAKYLAMRISLELFPSSASVSFYFHSIN